MRPISYEAVRALFARASQSATSIRRGPTVIEWDISGNCSSPATRELHGLPSSEAVHQLIGVTAEGERLYKPGRRVYPKFIRVGRFTPIPLTIILHARCRKCDHCRAKRGAMWRLRAQAETRDAARTWFGTITLNPAAHDHVLHTVRQRCMARGQDYDALPYGEQFSLRHNACSTMLTKYLKRVRAKSAARFRFLLVAEAHKSGLPHYHMLVHECDGSAPVRHAVLSAEWSVGFTQWKVVDDLRQATYLCKYLSKNTRARVRASIGYGKPKVGLSHSDKVA